MSGELEIDRENRDGRVVVGTRNRPRKQRRKRCRGELEIHRETETEEMWGGN